LDLLFNGAWYIAAVAAGIVLVIVFAIRGDYSGLPAIAENIVVGVIVLGFATWVSRDARDAARRLRQERRRQKEMGCETEANNV
jgi:uncharacterized membrane protein YdcZ (DUF606 family)